MILFVLVTATLNIALGYGLAIYLGTARSSTRRPATNEHLSEHSSYGAEALDDLAAVSMTGVGEDLAISIESADTPSRPAPELEQEVLAGIEEFRNQLAQMKAGHEDVDAASARSPAAALA